MNLCLSGLSGCYAATDYPTVVTEAATRIRTLAPDAVTVTEGCRRDVVGMARQLGYRVRFARIIYAGSRLSCVDPSGRGLFGDAVLTRSPIVGFETRAFTAQGELEERRWLCATTRSRLDVCTAHLEVPSSDLATAARDAQCAELADVLATRASGTVVFGGDLNRRGSCAPPGAWTLTDSAAQQDPGIQHGYGGGDLVGPTSEVVPMQHSDHDLLVVRATLSPDAPPGDGDARRDARPEPRGRGSDRR